MFHMKDGNGLGYNKVFYVILGYKSFKCIKCVRPTRYPFQNMINMLTPLQFIIYVYPYKFSATHFLYRMICQMQCRNVRMGIVDNLLAQNQSDSLHISFSIFCLAAMGFCDALLMVVSSANKIDLE